MRVLEGLGDIVFSDDLQPLRWSQRSIFVQGLVDHIPTIDPPLVAAHNGKDMLAHPLEQRLAGERLALVVLKNPSRSLGVPNQAVADDEHMILFAELDILVGQLEGIDAGPGMNALPFEDVFRSDGAELAGDESRAADIGPSELAGIESCADHEVALIGLLQRGGFLGRGHKSNHEPHPNCQSHLQDLIPPSQYDATPLRQPGFQRSCGARSSRPQSSG